MTEIKPIISQGNEILGVIENDTIYLKDTNSGGVSLTNQMGTAYLYTQLEGVFGKEALTSKHSKETTMTDIYYLDSQQEPTAWINFTFAKPDAAHSKKLLQLFKTTPGK